MWLYIVLVQIKLWLFINDSFIDIAISYYYENCEFTCIKLHFDKNKKTLINTYTLRTYLHIMLCYLHWKTDTWHKGNFITYNCHSLLCTLPFKLYANPFSWQTIFLLLLSIIDNERSWLYYFWSVMFYYFALICSTY